MNRLLEEVSEVPAPSVLEHLIYLASRAPSLENSQPWLFESHDDHLKLKYDKTKSVDLSENRSRDYISLGAVLENLRIASENEHYHITIKYQDSRLENESQPEVAKIFFKKIDSDERSPLSHFLLTRFTDRAPYEKRALDRKLIQELKQLCGDQLLLVENRSQMNTWFKAIRALKKSGAQKEEKQILNSGAFAIIFAKTAIDSPQSFLEVGMIYQQACLIAEKHDASVQPYDHFATFKENESVAAFSLIRSFFPVGHRPLMCFRLGYSTHFRPAKTLRHLPSKTLRDFREDKSKNGFNYETAFRRNLGLLTIEDQERIKHATVALPGLGGVGGQHLITLARLGVGGFHIADEDSFELKNFNRQYGATMSSIGKDKAEVMEKAVRDINPDVRLKKWNKFIDESNVEEFLSGCDLMIDCLDAFSVEARRIVFTQAQKMRIPIISAGPVGFSCSLIILMPDSLSFDEYIDYKEGDDDTRNFIRFLLGVTPRPYYLKYLKAGSVNSGERVGPSVATSIALCAGFAGVEAIKILLGKRKVHAVPHYHYFDPYLMKMIRGYIPFGNRNPVQKAIIWFAWRKMLRKPR